MARVGLKAVMVVSPPHHGLIPVVRRNDTAVTTRAWPLEAVALIG